MFSWKTGLGHGDVEDLGVSWQTCFRWDGIPRDKKNAKTKSITVFLHVFSNCWNPKDAVFNAYLDLLGKLKVTAFECCCRALTLQLVYGDPVHWCEWKHGFSQTKDRWTGPGGWRTDGRFCPIVFWMIWNVDYSCNRKLVNNSNSEIYCA